MQEIQLSYPGYFLVFCAILALVYAVALYFKTDNWKDNFKSLPYWLGFLRFLSVGTLLFLLLTPFIKNLIESQQDPIIVIAEDNSASIPATMSSEAITSYKDGINNLDAALSERFEVKRFTFGSEVNNIALDSFNAQSTNIASQLSFLENQFADQNIGAVIIASDGIYNEGNNPIYSQAKFKAPIHTVALGDTTIRRDLFIKNVLHNRIAYLGDDFSLQVDVQAFNATGSSSKITIEKQVNGKTTALDSKDFTISSNNYFKSFPFVVTASDVGNVKYIIKLNRISDELSQQNNTREIYLEILDARQQILLFANAPHPDLAALKSIIEINKNYEVDIVTAREPVPNVNSYDIVVLHNLPSSSYDINPTLALLKSRRIPTIFFVGNQTDIVRFNAAQDALDIQGQLSSSNESQALWESGFNGYTIEQKLKDQLVKFPPVTSPFGEYKAGSKSEVLLTQKIGKVETKYPLLLYSDFENWKVSVFAGEGIWKWKIHEYQLSQGYEQMKEFINKMIQYSSKKDDKRKFKAFVSKNAFKENEEVLFDAQLYNNNFELINDPDAFLEIKDAANNSYNYTFSKSDNYYNMDVGLLPEGAYTFKAKTTFNGTELSSTGRFAIQSIQKELYDLTARHNLLSALSERYGGQMFYPQNILSLQDSILNSPVIKPVVYQRTKTESLLNMKWLFGVLAFLLCLEWFIRRFYGSY